MKQIPAALVSHLGLDATSWCLIARVMCKDGTLIASTDLDADLTYDPAVVDPHGTGDAWGSAVHRADLGFEASRFQFTADLSVDNSEFKIFIGEGSGITEAQLRAGLLDYAEFRIYRVNFLDLTQGHEVVATGTLGESHFSETGGSIENRSLTQQTKQPIAELFSITCPVPYGSPRCGRTFVWTAATITSVDTVEPDRIITASGLAAPADTYRLGVIKATSGQNNGWEGEVQVHASGGVLTLLLPAPYPFAEDDTFEIREDCSKVHDDEAHGCVHHWDAEWVSHFRGHPHVPIDGSPLVPNAEIRRSSGGGGGK